MAHDDLVQAVRHLNAKFEAGQRIVESIRVASVGHADDIDRTRRIVDSLSRRMAKVEEDGITRSNTVDSNTLIQ